MRKVRIGGSHENQRQSPVNESVSVMDGLRSYSTPTVLTTDVHVTWCREGERERKRERERASY